MATQTPKYPRLQVSGTRHNKLAAEARKRDISMQELGEEKFKIADKASKAQ